MQKNVASQKWTVFAFDITDNSAKTGDAAQITANIKIDGGGSAGTNDTNPTELEDGYYEFDLTQAETNGEHIRIFPASSTGSIQVIGVPGAIYTTPANFPDFSVEASTGRTDVASIAGTAQTANDNGVDINTLVSRGDAHLLIGNSGVGLTHLALASVNTEIRLSELDSGNMPSDIDAIPTTAMRGTDSALLAANVPTNFSSLGIESDGDITKVNLVDTNTDMRGTDSAALASNYTSARAGYIDNINGHTAQTGDSYTLIGNAGVGLTHLATSANLTTVDSIVDSILAMLDDPRSEPGQGAPAVNADAMTKLDYLYKFMRNKVETGTTSIKIWDDAGTTLDHVSTISAAGSTFTRGEFGTGA